MGKNKKIDVNSNVNRIANVFVILVGLALIGGGGYRTLKPLLFPPAAIELSSGHSILGLEEINFKKAGSTILIAMDIKCPYCTKGLPLYKQLATQSSENNNVRVIALFANKREDVERYLNEHDIKVDFIPEVEMAALKIDVTPTIAWVDRNREIIRSYEGLLNEKQEQEFLKMFKNKLINK